MGERIIVKVNGMSSARMDTSFIDSESSLIYLNIVYIISIPFLERTKKDAICNVPLPATQPLASPDAQVAQRLFIVLAAVSRLIYNITFIRYIFIYVYIILIHLTLLQNLPHSILKNIFSCWKGLIDVYLLPNKNCGYVKYAERDSAQKAIGVLNGAEICGTKIKV